MGCMGVRGLLSYSHLRRISNGGVMKKLGFLVLAVLFFGSASMVFASSVSVFYNTPGAIVSADETITFDNLDVTSSYLTNYTSQGVIFGTTGASHCCDYVLDSTGGSGGVYYPAGGSFNNTVISLANSGTMFGIQMNLGDGYTPQGNHNFWFEVLNGSTVLDSGTFTADTTQAFLFGIRDDSGFTTLRLVGSGLSAASGTAYNAIAFDNVVVDLSRPVPEPASLLLLGGGLLGLSALVRRRMRKP